VIWVRCMLFLVGDTNSAKKARFRMAFTDFHHPLLAVCWTR
jgi:hypothetical protein